MIFNKVASEPQKKIRVKCTLTEAKTALWAEKGLDRFGHLGGAGGLGKVDA